MVIGAQLSMRAYYPFKKYDSQSLWFYEVSRASFLGKTEISNLSIWLYLFVIRNGFNLPFLHAGHVMPSASSVVMTLANSSTPS